MCWRNSSGRFSKRGRESLITDVRPAIHNVWQSEPLRNVLPFDYRTGRSPTASGGKETDSSWLGVPSRASLLSKCCAFFTVETGALLRR
jgi:hypothetical protein